MTDEKHDGIKENKNNPPPPIYFNILFYGLIIWAIAFTAYFLTSGWSSHGEFQGKMANYNNQYNHTQSTIEMQQK